MVCCTKSEGRVFNAVHQKEHRALRFYDDLCRELPLGGTDMEVISELRSRLASNGKLKRNFERLKKRIDQFKSEMEEIKSDKSRLLIELEEERRLNMELKKKWDDFGEERALKNVKELKREVKLLTDEIDVLNEELIEKTANKPIFCYKECIEDVDDNLSLEGKNIALIGGVESLIPFYRETVKSFYGVFYHHFGRCSVYKKEIEELVGKADVLFCSVDMNSHNACRYAKKVCKSKNKPYCFFKSSGLTTFRKKLIDFAIYQDSRSKERYEDRICGIADL
ncbi:DUF2325 domain-containing protein [Candidatus Methanoliparum sp. LAM-1]|nr:DUF2325 domain-containing protein [Candidatus Methanoliparum sp. LAM-1]